MMNMNADKVIEYIKSDIEGIVSSYIKLKKSGANHKGKCPFHDEKTASFQVNEAKGIYKCFGCGKGGDAINFIMEHEGVGFKEAVEIGAKKLNIDFEWKKSTDFDFERQKHIESLHIACNKVEQYFIEQVDHPEVQGYIQKRDMVIPEKGGFNIGYAPNGNKLLAYANKNGLKTDILEEVGVLKRNDKGTYDFFRSRLIFPISNVYGKTIAFAGRDISDDSEIKYLNTPESSIYVKGNELYGLNIARFAIKKEDKAYIVEGCPDVLRMHAIGVDNSVATCGTILTNAQVNQLKQFTNKASLVFDGDKAGQKAIDRNAEILIRNQFHVSVIVLPDQQDPDSLFTSKDIFLTHKEGQIDYIVYKTTQSAEKASLDPVYKSETIKQVARLISHYDKTQQEVYIDFAAGKIKPKKAWHDAIRELGNNEQSQKGINQNMISKHIKQNEFNLWGFFVRNNCYVFKNVKGDDFVEHSNFIMTPMYHIASPVNAKRLFELKNCKNEVEVIELTQKDMVNIAQFKVKIENLGNFLWTGGEIELNKVKAWLYENTKSCKEITQMGWQKENFFAWGNGIFNGEKFILADRFGIVYHNESYYYIPACSEIFKGDDKLFEFERNFLYKEGKITLFDYAQKFVTVFGNNGIVTLSFYFACLFMDIIAKRFDKFPLLNMYGQKGTGKNTCAESILYFFSKKGTVPNLHNSSKAAIADHVAASANAVCVLDEYRDDLEMEKRELLKGFWDKTGRTRMNMDKDRKKETSIVAQGVIVCGQQIATADIALFSRFVAIGFTKVNHSKEEKLLFGELEEINKQGLTHITHELLKHREPFGKNYNTTVNEVSKRFDELLGKAAIETRIYNNWLTIASAYASVVNIMELPFKYDETIQLFVEIMVGQSKETSHNDDLANFWKTVQFLISSNLLFQDGDYKVEYTDRIIRTFKQKGVWRKNEILLKEPQNLFYLSVSRVFGLYKSQVIKEGDKPLPPATVEYYLQNSPAFICDSKKVSFKKINARTGIQEYYINGKGKFTSTSALIFYLDRLDLNVEENNSNQEF